MMPFLAKIADRLLEKFPESMEGVAVVLPSKRAVVFLKHYLSQRINKPIFLPEFYAIEEFAEQLSGLQVLDNMSLQFRLYKAYLQHPPQKVDSFDDFLNWSNVLLHDFNEIDRNIIDAKAIYTNLKNVKELEGWSVEDWSFANADLTPMQTDYSNFFEGMHNWYTSFSASLLSENLAYQGMAYRMAAEQIAKRDISWKKVWFVGLNALTKSEQEIVDFLKKEDIARVFWDADKFYYDNPIHEAGGFLREQRAKWSEIDFKGVGDYYGVEKEKFQAIACPKNTAQAKVVAEVIKGFSIADLEDSNTAIVLADEALLFPVLNNLPSAVKQLNVTMGSPLKNSTLFSFVEVLFTMQIHAINYKRNAFYYKDVIAVVEHPYFSKITDEKAVLALKKFIIKDNIVFVSKGNIHSLLLGAEKVEKLFKIWETVDEALQCLDDLVLLLRKPLVGKKGTIASEVLATFSKSLLMLKKLAAEVDFDFELKTLQTVLKQLVSKEMIPFKGEPLKGVQLMGILESRTLDFKNVIMLSVNEGKLPKGKSVNSFIPYDMKRYFKLPTYAESDAVFAYHFYRLLQRANNVTLVYNSETDDFGSGEKSRFITQLLSEYKTTPIQQLVYKGADLEVKNPSEIVVKNNGLEAEIKSWAANGVSPSALNKYNNCSLQFYYHYLAKIRKDDGVDEFADASTMGTAIHNALELHYPYGILTQSYIKEHTKAILATVKTEFETELSAQGMKEGKNYLSLQIAQKLTKDFLKLELQLLEEAANQNKQVTIAAKEEALEHQLTIDGVDFKLIGKADRIDFEGDLLRIIDYKTGKVEDNEVVITEYDEIITNPKKAKAFQLLMYAYLYLKMNPQYIGFDVVAGNFSFKNLKSGLIKVSKKISFNEKQAINVDANALDSFEEQLELVLMQIMNNDFVQTDVVSACEWCDYKTVCKR